MIQLTNLSSEVLSTRIRNLSPMEYDVIMIENKLLDGSMHLQTIGDPQAYKTFEILCNDPQVALINQAWYLGQQLKLIEDDKYYIGFITKPDWQRFNYRHPEPNYRYYTASARINITEEGSI